MEKRKAKEILEKELECSSKSDHCNRDCLNCELIREQADVLEAYRVAIKALGEDER